MSVLGGLFFSKFEVLVRNTESLLFFGGGGVWVTISSIAVCLFAVAPLYGSQYCLLIVPSPTRGLFATQFYVKSASTAYCSSTAGSYVDVKCIYYVESISGDLPGASFIFFHSKYKACVKWKVSRVLFQRGFIGWPRASSSGAALSSFCQRKK